MPGIGRKNDPTILKVELPPSKGRGCVEAIIHLSCGHIVQDLVYPRKYLRGQYRSLVIGKHHRCWECGCLDGFAAEERHVQDLLALGSTETLFIFEIETDPKVWRCNWLLGALERAFYAAKVRHANADRLDQNRYIVRCIHDGVVPVDSIKDELSSLSGVSDVTVGVEGT